MSKRLDVKPLVPIGDGHLGTIALRLLRGIWLDLVLAILAPNNEPDLSCGSITKRHRGATVGLHLPLSPIGPFRRGWRVPGEKSVRETSFISRKCPMQFCPEDLITTFTR